MTTDFVAIAVIRQAHGVRGEVKVASYTDPAEDFLTYTLTDAEGIPFRLHKTGRQKELFLCRIEGVPDRNAAELLKGRELGVARDALPVLEGAQTYSSALIGLRIVDEAGAEVGTVSRVVNYGASDILVIEGPQGELMLPYAHQFFPGDPVDGVLSCRLPETVAAKEQA